jgi:heme/copper-type cytochrome/quinol oxidase subunit 4
MSMQTIGKILLVILAIVAIWIVYRFQKDQ